MEVVKIISISLGLAADACAVSMTSGLTIRHIKVNKALKIALFFGVFQGIMPVIGWICMLLFRNHLTSIDHWIAFGLLSYIGAKMIHESLQPEDKEKVFNPLDSQTLTALAIATSIDALAAGLGLSVLQTPILLAASLIGAITFGLSFLCVYIGHSCGDIFKNKLEIVGGLILILIGSKILMEHLTTATL